MPGLRMDQQVMTGKSHAVLGLAASLGKTDAAIVHDPKPRNKTEKLCEQGM